jgi:hypothetical protein
MQQIKIFRGIESEIEELEQRINRWLSESQVRVVQMFGNISPQSAGADAAGHGLTKGQFAPSDILVVVLYETPRA